MAASQECITASPCWGIPWNGWRASIQPRQHLWNICEQKWDPKQPVEDDHGIRMSWPYQAVTATSISTSSLPECNSCVGKDKLSKVIRWEHQPLEWKRLSLPQKWYGGTPRAFKMMNNHKTKQKDLSAERHFQFCETAFYIKAMEVFDMQINRKGCLNYTHWSLHDDICFPIGTKHLHSDMTSY